MGTRRAHGSLWTPVIDTGPQTPMMRFSSCPFLPCHVAGSPDPGCISFLVILANREVKWRSLCKTNIHHLPFCILLLNAFGVCVSAASTSSQLVEAKALSNFHFFPPSTRVCLIANLPSVSPMCFLTSTVKVSSLMKVNNCSHS